MVSHGRSESLHARWPLSNALINHQYQYNQLAYTSIESNMRLWPEQIQYQSMIAVSTWWNRTEQKCFARTRFYYPTTIEIEYFISMPTTLQYRDIWRKIGSERDIGHLLLVESYLILSLKSTRELSNCRPKDMSKGSSLKHRTCFLGTIK